MAPWRVTAMVLNVGLEEGVVKVQCGEAEWCNTQRRMWASVPPSSCSNRSQGLTLAGTV